MEPRAWVADTLLAVAVAAVSVIFTLPDLVGSLVGVALSASLAFRRSVPVLALGLASVSAVVHALLLTQLTFSIVAVPLLVYSLVRWSSRTLGWVALAIALAGAIGGPFGWLRTASVNDVLATVAAYGGVVVVAYFVGLRGRERSEVEAAAARAASAEERNEIAREVHDIVAHSLSMIAVQAEAGRALAIRDPGRAAEIFGVITAESRKSLGEIRDMVGLLRRGDSYRPAPGLADLRELVAGVGQRARLDVVYGDALGPVLEFTVYRVVQESLTNFVRHAGPLAKVDVNIVGGNGKVEVIVRDDGRGAAATTDGKGHGLETMRERVHAQGGTVTAGPVPTGGYEVHAIFPLETAA